MNTFLFFFFSTFLSLCMLFGQASEGWIQQKNGPEDDVLVDLDFLNPATAVACAHAIYKTSDAGASWQQKYSTGYLIGGQYFYDETLGITVGDYATINMTKDGGETWETINGPSEKGRFLESVCIVDPENIWACGSKINDDGYLESFLINSSDSGKTWIEKELKLTKRLHEIRFTSNSHGWIAGEGGILLETKDGGQNWVSIDLQPARSLYSIFFIDDSTGWIVSESGLIFHTKDAGMTWETQDCKIPIRFYAVFFTDRNNGWIGGQYGNILHTEDGGTTWVRQKSNASDRQQVNDLFFMNPDTGWAVGTDNLLLKTENGGEGNPTLLESESQIAREFVLDQNYPNPFNPTTTINYQLSQDSHISLKVFDIEGREVTTLVDQSQTAGKYQIKFEASDLVSGVYFYLLKSGKFIQSRKFLLLK